MENELLNVVAEMVKSGGQLAVWGIIAYLGMVILKVAVQGGIIWGCLKIISSVVTHCWDNYQDKRSQRINLISEDMSKRFVQIVEEFKSQTGAILSDLSTQLKNFQDSSKKSTK